MIPSRGGAELSWLTLWPHSMKGRLHQAPPIRSPQASRGPVIILLPHWPARLTGESAGRIIDIWPSNHGHPAVDVKRVSGHVSGLRRGQEQNGGSDFVGAAQPRGRHRGEDHL